MLVGFKARVMCVSGSELLSETCTVSLVLGAGA